MNMKKMMTVAAMAAAGVLLADVSVEDVKCTQRYPWNGLVDIEYTIACDDPEAEIYVNPVGFNGDTGLTVFPTHFTGDGATNTVKAGKHTMVWDAKADMGLFASKNFQIKMYAGKTLAPYVVVDLSSGPDGENFPIRYSLTGPDISDDTCRTTELWLRLIPPGTFMMGSPADELGRSDNEDLHKVTITQPFYIGVFEVTQEQWYRVMGRTHYGNNNSILGDNTLASYPVTYCLYWNELRGDHNKYSADSFTVDGNTFMGKLRLKTDKNGFDLPTEAQWEYACRIGTRSALNDGTNLTGVFGCNNLNRLGRYYSNGFNGSDERHWDNPPQHNTTEKVGCYLANSYGIFDMHGNVGEICRDTYTWNESINLGKESSVDPLHVAQSDLHHTQCRCIVRGGNWYESASSCRAAARLLIMTSDGQETKGTGFRISCPGNLQK